MNTNDSCKFVLSVAKKINPMTKLILKDQSYQIIGKCFEVHNELGPGFLEVVYKDALELEFQQAGIPYEREKEYSIIYKGNFLRRKYYADFVVFNSVILEVKAVSGITDDFVARCINYLKVSGNKLALLVNFGEPKLNYQRIVY
jgi:GxxExxY protein